MRCQFFELYFIVFSVFILENSYICTSYGNEHRNPQSEDLRPPTVGFFAQLNYRRKYLIWLEDIFLLLALLF
nr:MAG TPA: hypothetical protein [Bacteriophage sp.]